MNGSLSVCISLYIHLPFLNYFNYCEYIEFIFFFFSVDHSYGLHEKNLHNVKNSLFVLIFVHFVTCSFHKIPPLNQFFVVVRFLFCINSPLQHHLERIDSLLSHFKYTFNSHQRFSSLALSVSNRLISLHT